MELTSDLVRVRTVMMTKAEVCPDCRKMASSKRSKPKIQPYAYDEAGRKFMELFKL